MITSCVERSVSLPKKRTSGDPVLQCNQARLVYTVYTCTVMKYFSVLFWRIGLKYCVSYAILKLIKGYPILPLSG
jgi:hypothetical protein